MRLKQIDFHNKNVSSKRTVCCQVTEL